MKTSPYQMCINNIASYIRKQNNSDPDAINAFQASEILAISFCKSKEEILADIFTANQKIKKIKTHF